MSERGSFTTEYLYCEKCFEACKEVLCQNEKWLKGIAIPTWEEDANATLPIIAGKIGGFSSGEEIWDMKNDYIPKIQEKMCKGHNIRICVFSDSGGSVIFDFDKDDIKTTEVK